MSHDARKRLSRQYLIESLEDRVVMSADPIGGLLGGSVSHHALDEAPALSHHDLNQTVEAAPDFWLDPGSELSYDEQLDEIEQALSSAHDASGLTAARASYGFRGAGQTVAVIDSGIAWDHYALGNGFGSNYRVVGGWDFTEGDADPYDDGSAGSHGTHVAGIVGASGNSSAEIGVAPDVDLVGLRVFDDAGNGYFSWVEQALQWVHTNRNAFENPITAVNLSLGTNWNAETVPSWAMLEDEFAQLKADGIFISVSAGNSFTSYNTPGLSYPAASSHVVPVMAADDSGSLSYFSQRLDRAIAAPGRYIRSTVPDYSGNNNGQTDDWSYKSGTSMAAPYVAGASVLIREAMEFVGYTNITQDTIYNHMMATAESIYDSATSLYYSSLDVEAALDALMPTDDYGSTMETAYDLGTINPNASVSALSSMNGVIGELSDSDYFTFTAGATGTVTFAASNTTHYLDANWQGFGGEGWSDATGDAYTMNVVAGQQYTVALSSDDGVGRYDLSVSAESTFTYTDWGTVAGQTTNNVGSDGGETWYRVVAGQDGVLTVGMLNATGTIGIELYDSSLNLTGVASSGRVDVYASQGDEYYVLVNGAGVADLQLTNLVSASGTAVNVAGTSGDDALTFSAGDTQHLVSVNGVVYAFTSSFTTFNLDGGDGNDSVTLTGTSGDETASLGAGTALLSGAQYGASVIAEHLTIDAGGGSDRAIFTGTTGDESFAAWADRAQMSGAGFSGEATNIEGSTAHSGGGNDTAVINGSAANEVFTATAAWVRMSGGGVDNYAFGFAQTTGNAGGGSDVAYLHDTTGADAYSAAEGVASMTGDGYNNSAVGFDRAVGIASEGSDTATFNGGSGHDRFLGRHDRSTMVGDGYFNDAFGFDIAIANGGAGADQAFLYDTAGNEVLTAQGDQLVMQGTSYRAEARGFAVNTAYSTGGSDVAHLHGTSGSDVYSATPTWARLDAVGLVNYAIGFSETHGYGGSGGTDLAYLNDSAGDDNFVADQSAATLSGAGYTNTAHGFDRAVAVGSTGDDTATFNDTSGNDVYRTWSDYAVMSSAGYNNSVWNFDSTSANSTTGVDHAYFYDTAGDEVYNASSTSASLAGVGYSHTANGFDTTTAYSSGGNDVANFVGTAGNDAYTAQSLWSRMSGAGYTNYAFYFGQTNADGNGGYDVAYLHDTAGDDSFTASGNRATLSGTGYSNTVDNFGRAVAFATLGNDTAVLTDSAGDDDGYASGSLARIRGDGYSNESYGFDTVTLDSQNGGDDDLVTEAVDYAFTQSGAWT